MSAIPSITIDKKKKVRPRLKPISTAQTDNSFGGNSDDGLGFGHILTPGEVTTNSKEEDENINGVINGNKTSEETLHANQSVALPELSPREPSPQSQKSTPEALSTEKRQAVTTVNGIDCMTQYSSITNPSTATTPSSSAYNGGAVNNLDQLSFLHAEISLESSRDDDNGEEEEEGEGVNKSAMIGNELSPIKVSSTNNEGVNVQKDQFDTSNDDEVSVSSSESSSSSSSSSSSEEESEASDLPTPVDNNNETSQLQELQNEISSRQRLLSKLLRGKEGTLYASIVQEQEEMVNSQLLGKDDASETSSSPTALQRIKSILVDEYYHTLPGAFSLIVHCLLYVTVYAIISKSLTKLCDVTIIYFTGWDANKNWFDSTNHELVFYAILLFFSLAAARVTGVIFDWNENRMYQKRVAFQVRNKWYMKCFDTKLMDYFHEGALANQYEKKNGSNADNKAIEGGNARQSNKKKWGPKIKYVLDLFSFFICYKCVDSFVTTYLYLGSEITDSVLQNLPSRQLQEERDAHLVATGFSYACPSVTSALDNPYAKDMLNWIASLEIESEEAKNWLTNAKKCGWSNDMDKVEVHSDLEEEEEEEEASPTFLRQRRIMSAQDDKYLQATISREAYYDLIGDPNPRFSDPDKEMFFLLTSTTVCFGLLYALGIPFLLI